MACLAKLVLLSQVVVKAGFSLEVAHPDEHVLMRMLALEADIRSMCHSCVALHGKRVLLRRTHLGHCAHASQNNDPCG